MNKTIVTPKGRASWPYLHEKNTNFTKDPEEQHFECSIIITEEDAEEFIKKIQDLYESEKEAAIQAAKTPKEKRVIRESERNIPIRKERDEDDQLTGNVIIKARSKSQPMVVDSHGNPMGPKVGSGSEIRMSVNPRFWKTPKGSGIKLWLNAVQVIELVEWGAYGGPKSFEDTGFSVVEDGYVAEDTGDEDEDGEEEFATTSTGTASDGDF